MATLRLAIDASAARLGANVFIQELNRIRVAAGVVRPFLSGIFGPLITGPTLYRALADIQNFEYALEQLRGVSGATAEEMEVLTQSARDLGLTGIKTAYDAADAFLIMSKAGLKAGDILAAAPAVIDLATAHTLDLESATRMVTNTMQQFGLAADQTTRVVDVMTKASFESTIEIEDIAKSLKFAGVTAAQTGESIEDTAAMITVLGNAGMRGALAGTYLRGVFGSLLKPTQVTSRAIEKLGKDVRDLNPATRPAIDILQELHDAGVTLQDAFKIFGVFRANAAYTLIHSIDDVKKVKDELQNAGGVTQHLADLMSNTLMGSFKKLRAALYEIALELGDAGLLGAAKTAVKGLRDIVLAMAGLDDHIEGNKESVKSWARIIEAAGGGILMNVFVQSIYATTKALLSLSLAMITNPVGALLSSIALLTGAYIYFKDTLIEVGDQSGTVTDFIVAGWEYVRDFFVIMWPSIQAAGEEAWTAVATTAKEVWDYLTKLFAVDNVPWLISFDALAHKAKEVGNFIIGSVYAVRDAADTVFGQINSYGVQIAKTYDGTFQSILIGIEKAGRLSFTGDFLALGLKITDDLKRDYIGEVQTLASAAGTVFSEAFKKRAAAVGVDPWGYMSYASGVQSIVNRANSLRLEREATEKLKKERLDAARADMHYLTGVKGVTESLDEQASAIDDITRREEQGYAKLQDMIRGYQNEVETIFLRNSEAEELKAYREAEKIALDAGIELEKEYTDALANEVRLVNQLRGQKYFADQLNALRDESSLINITNDERQIRQKLLEAENTAREFGLENADKYLAALEKELRLLQRMQHAKQLADDVGQAFSDAFMDIVVGAKSAGEAIQNLGLVIYKMLLNEMVGKTLAGLVSGVFYQTFGTMFTPSAHGNVFDGGSIVPYARGGIARRPTLQPMANGGTALFGEAGPEAIMPLQRMADGRLGVAADAGGGGRPVVVNITVNTPNADSFRRSSGQIAQEMQRAASRVTRTF